MSGPSPVASAGIEAAKLVAKAAFDAFATKVYEENKGLCGAQGENIDHLAPVEKAFCIAIRAASGAAEKEWKENLTRTVDQIKKTLDEVNRKVDVINTNVTTLLREMNLVHLEISELARGADAYKAIGEIRVRFGEFLISLGQLPEKAADQTATQFYAKLLHVHEIQTKIAIVFDALVGTAAGKESLLRNIADQLAVKAQNKSPLVWYALYEDYVESILFDLLKGNLLVEAAVRYFETLAALNRPFSDPLPFGTAEWKRRWNAHLQNLLDGFNAHLEWIVLTRYADEARGMNPRFLPAEALRVFRNADAFCSRQLGQYGVRGRIFSMGGQYDGKLALEGGAAVEGRKFTVQVGKKLDYWTATNAGQTRAYDKVDFSDTWSVHRFHIEAVTPGTKRLQAPLPYLPPPIAIEATENVDGKPTFGSFVEIARAGGSFAFFSGDWTEGREDADNTNLQNGQAAPDVGQTAELRRLSDHVIRDGSNILATVKRPEIGVAKHGQVHLGVLKFGVARGPSSNSVLKASFRTWVQTSKVIKFPDLPGAHIDMIVSLAPSLQQTTDFPNAAALNTWFGKDGNITDTDISAKQVVASVKFGTLLPVTSTGCRVEGGINLIPISISAWSFSQPKNPSAWQVSQGAAQAMPRDSGRFREGTASPRTTRFSFPSIPSTGLMFRFQAFYDLTVETSGPRETPFAVCARGMLENVHFEVVPGKVGTSGPPESLVGMLKSAECRCLAFDYDGTGSPDHVVAYIPRSGGNIAAFGLDGSDRFAQRPFQWFAEYDYVSNVDDRTIAFDYNLTGRPDHLVFHRAGRGRIAVLKNNAGIFARNHDQSVQRPEPADRAFAYDFGSSGKLDHLAVYRPGRGRFLVLKRSGSFSPVYDGASGIEHDAGLCALNQPQDRMFAFDYEGTGKQDHLVLYRPGSGRIWLFKKHPVRGFKIVYESSAGIGGYDLALPSDRGLAFDYSGNGRLDHLVFYRPGRGAIYIIGKTPDGQFKAVYKQGDVGARGGGIGGVDLANPADRVIAFDYDRKGKADHLLLYRPGAGVFWVVKNTNGGFSRVYPP